MNKDKPIVFINGEEVECVPDKFSYSSGLLRCLDIVRIFIGEIDITDIVIPEKCVFEDTVNNKFIDNDGNPVILYTELYLKVSKDTLSILRKLNQVKIPSLFLIIREKFKEVHVIQDIIFLKNNDKECVVKLLCQHKRVLK